MGDTLPVVAAGHDRVDLIDPTTGELVALAAATDGLLARALDEIANHRREVDTWRSIVGAEVLRRMDDVAHWTIHADGFKLTAPSADPPPEYDAAALRAGLLVLAGAGRFATSAVDAAVAEVLTYKVRAAGVKALAKLGADVRAVIDAHTGTAVDKPRAVRVTRE